MSPLLPLLLLLPILAQKQQSIYLYSMEDIEPRGILSFLVYSTMTPAQNVQLERDLSEQRVSFEFFSNRDISSMPYTQLPGYRMSLPDDSYLLYCVQFEVHGYHQPSNFIMKTQLSGQQYLRRVPINHLQYNQFKDNTLMHVSNSICLVVHVVFFAVCLPTLYRNKNYHAFFNYLRSIQILTIMQQVDNGLFQRSKYFFKGPYFLSMNEQWPKPLGNVMKIKDQYSQIWEYLSPHTTQFWEELEKFNLFNNCLFIFIYVAMAQLFREGIKALFRQLKNREKESVVLVYLMRSFLFLWDKTFLLELRLVIFWELFFSLYKQIYLLQKSYNKELSVLNYLEFTFAFLIYLYLVIAILLQIKNKRQYLRNQEPAQQKKIGANLFDYYQVEIRMTTQILFLTILLALIRQQVSGLIFVFYCLFEVFYLQKKFTSQNSPSFQKQNKLNLLGIMLYFSGMNGIKVCLVFDMTLLYLCLNYLINLMVLVFYVANILFIRQQLKTKPLTFSQLLLYIQPSYKQTILNSRFYILQQVKELSQEQQPTNHPSEQEKEQHKKEDTPPQDIDQIQIEVHSHLLPQQDHHLSMKTSREHLRQEIAMQEYFDDDGISHGDSQEEEGMESEESVIQ